MESHEGRLDWLIPLRVGRMTASPYGFLRGTAIVMAEDVARLPSTGITPVICGDSHLGNFGFYASPERDLVIDLNDFDEAHPGGWEWDLRRLVASIWVAGRQNGATEADCEAAVVQCVAAYRTEVRELSETPLLARSYQRLDVDHLQETTTHESLRAEIQRAVARARTRTSDRALPRFTHEHAGPAPDRRGPAVDHQGQRRRRRRCWPPRSTSTWPPWRRTGGARWAATRSSTSRTRWSGWAASGCAPTWRCWRAAARTTSCSCSSSRPGGRCWREYVHGESAWHAHQGQRVVEYQQALQTVSDPLLGWTTADGRQYYVRQFRNMKGTVALDSIDGVGAGRLRGHRRASAGQGPCPDQWRVDDRRATSAVSDKLDVALARFARLYADQTEADHQALVQAADRGIMPVERGL